MPDFWGVTTLSFQLATPYFFDAVVPYGPRTERGHVYMTHGDHFMTFRHTPILPRFGPITGSVHPRALWGYGGRAAWRLVDAA